MDDDVWDQVESHYQRDNCTTKNEFIEKAIRFYSGYLDTDSADAYLPRVLADVLEGKLGALGNRMGHLLFKLSVDQNLMGNILAADIEIDPDQLRKARVRCVKEVKETIMWMCGWCFSSWKAARHRKLLGEIFMA